MAGGTGQSPRPRGGGTIGVISGDLARYSDFSIALMHLQKPPDWKLAWSKGMDVVGNMNRLRRNFVGDFLFVLGDDHVFAGDLLLRLLSHQVDVVVPLCLKRTPPYDPVVYFHENDKGEHIGYTDLPEDELTPIYACGSAGMLIHRRVFDAIPEPVFETDGRGMNEDLVLCRKIREAGFQIWCDPGAPLGHIGVVGIWPKFDNGEWKIALALDADREILLRRFVKRDEPVAA